MALDFGADRALSRKAMKAELLDAETELQLAYAWKNNRDEKALHRLIRAYMRSNFNGFEIQTIRRTNVRFDPRGWARVDEGCRQI
jgi:hypothetical protein